MEDEIITTEDFINNLHRHIKICKAINYRIARGLQMTEELEDELAILYAQFELEERMRN